MLISYRRLTPHEGPNTDVILLGHSMGGFLTAEVAIQLNSDFNGLKHRLIGTINFDVPFLGMHPGVVKSGLASLFVPSPDINSTPDTPGPSGLPAMSPGNDPSRSQLSLDSNLSTRASDLPADPNYNPAFDNDVNLPVRSGWKGVWHFVNKHKDDIIGGATQMVKAHVEFGWAMADYPAMRKRYARIRALEEEDENARRSAVEMRAVPPRVRFVNFYTASTGRPKKPKDPALAAQVHAFKTNTPVDPAAFKNSSSAFASSESSSQNGPKIAVDEPEDQKPTRSKSRGTHSTQLPDSNTDEDEFEYEDPLDFADGEHLGPEMQHVHPMPVSSASEAEEDSESETDSLPETTEDLSLQDSPQLGPESSHVSQSPSTTALESGLKPSQTLPPLPPLPAKPVEPYTSSYTDPDTLKTIQKEYSRALKAYDKAVKNHEKALADREKLDEKWLRKQQKVTEKTTKPRKKSSAKRDDKMIRKQQKLDEKTTKRLGKVASKEAKRSGSSQDVTSPPPLQQPQEQGITSQISPLLEEAGTPPITFPDELPPRQDQQSSKPLKDRKFCTLPARDNNGVRDPAWVRVYMKDMDEVTAHCGLFFDTRDAYEGFVAEVAETIQKWVGESEGERVARWMSLRDVD